MFEVNAKKSVLKSIDRLESKTKDILKELILVLKENPVPIRVYDVAKLKGHDSVYRIRMKSEIRLRSVLD